MAGSDQLLILGVGNILCSDDGIGVRAVEYLGEHYDFSPGVRVEDGGVVGAGLLSLIEGFSQIIIIDAVNFVGEEYAPGTVRVVPCEAAAGIASDVGSAHEIGIPELLALARFEGYEPEVTVVAVSPESVECGMELTETLSAALPKVVRATLGEIERLGFEARERTATGGQ